MRTWCRGSPPWLRIAPGNQPFGRWAAASHHTASHRSGDFACCKADAKAYQYDTGDAVEPVPHARKTRSYALATEQPCHQAEPNAGAERKINPIAGLNRERGMGVDNDCE